MIGKGARKLESAGNTQISTGHSLLKLEEVEEEALLNPHSPLCVSRTRDVSSHGDRPRGPNNHEEEGMCSGYFSWALCRGPIEFSRVKHDTCKRSRSSSLVFVV
jgi:hypothetical protein